MKSVFSEYSDAPEYEEIADFRRGIRLAQMTGGASAVAEELEQSHN